MEARAGGDMRRRLTMTRSEGRLKARKSISSISVLTLDSRLHALSPLARPKSKGADLRSRKLTKGFSLFQELYPLRLAPRSRPPRLPDFFHASKLTIAPKGAFSEVSSPSRDFSLSSPLSSPGLQVKVLSSPHRKHSPASSLLHYFTCLGPSSDLPRSTTQTHLSLCSSPYQRTRPISIGGVKRQGNRTSKV